MRRAASHRLQRSLQADILLVVMSYAAGFIGFGEVGSTFAAAMRCRGVEVAAYDIVQQKVIAAGVPYWPLDQLSSEAAACCQP
jgi:phosphoglycerate dehydrogenase-like enzyme